MKIKKVCIASSFNSADPAYSLNRVTQDQIKMLRQGGFDPVVIVSESFQAVEEYEHAELRKIPIVACHNEVKKDETFDADVDGLEKSFEEHLKDIDVIITHDFVYQPAALKHNVASRRVAEKHPEKRWLHWIHSATPPFTLANLRPYFHDDYLSLLEKPFPNSFYIAFNDMAVAPISKNFNVPEERVKMVPHPIDVCRFFGFDEKLTEFAEKKDLISAEAICIYPVRLDRGKQVEYVIKTMAKLKDFGLGVRVIVVDFHSTGGDKVTYRDELKNLGIDWGLTTTELSFTSDFCDEWKVRVPWESVAKLQLIANVYIHPSVSETYSLTTQEAGLAGAVIVLNQDFPPYRSIYGPKAIYRKFSSNWDVLAEPREAYGPNSRTETKYGPPETPEDQRKHFEEAYHTETAGKIAYHLTNDFASAMQIKIRTERNLAAVFKKYLEPLIYLD